MSKSPGIPQGKRGRGRPRKNIDDETREEVIRQFAAGASNRSVAKAFGIYRDKVQEMRLEWSQESAQGRSRKTAINVSGIAPKELSKLRHRPAIDIGLIHLRGRHVILGVRLQQLTKNGNLNLPPWPPKLPWPPDYVAEDLAPASALLGDRVHVIDLVKLLRNRSHGMSHPEKAPIADDLPQRL